MPNIRITVGAHHFEIEGTHDLALPPELLEVLHNWLDAVADTAAEAQGTIDEAAAKLKAHNDALKATVDATPAP